MFSSQSLHSACFCVLSFIVEKNNKEISRAEERKGRLIRVGVSGFEWR